MDEQQNNERWEKLLKLLQQANLNDAPVEDEINSLACELFISGGQNNRVEMSAFGAYANCTFVCLERDSFGPLVMGIKYGGKTYSYG